MSEGSQGNRNPYWQDNFKRPVTVECKNDWCGNYVCTINAAIHQGVYCESCKTEAKHLEDRRYDEKRKIRRKEDRRRQRLPVIGAS